LREKVLKIFFLLKGTQNELDKWLAVLGLGSAFFVALTTLFGKIGVADINSNRLLMGGVLIVAGTLLVAFK
jgi:uncharacterized membrane protein